MQTHGMMEMLFVVDYTVIMCFLCYVQAVITEERASAIQQGIGMFKIWFIFFNCSGIQSV